MNVVQGTKTHPSADWIYKRTREIIPHISLGTVYRNLSQLEESGQIAVLKDKTRVRYDGNVGDHDHFLCTTCRTWYDVDLLDTNMISAFSEKNKFMIHSISLELEGTCEACLEISSK